ncbi:DNA repair and recombination protein RadB [Candidatus Nanohalococcus occultus]|uniref:DNA repair and recombination protein RadB n=1 Tax=Candidatus Nanohalococcus occultus TaxID=2978047 RepID=A0ABY8CD46_9ARCH|nr:RecA/RadA recombinase [Candidatus Nanohaloarchaeota archaeon SVXNc]
MEVQRISTGSKPLDELLNGGLEKKVITNVFGESGTGKTNLCVQVAAEVAANGKKVIYIDTEGGFSPERFVQVASEDALEEVTMFEPLDFEQQENVLDSLEEAVDQETGLVVIDSLVSLYRLEVNDNNASDINQKLSGQLSELSKIARKHEIPVMVTNQVYSNFDGDGLELVGKDVPRYWSKCLLQLENDEKSLRTVAIEKHRSLPEGKTRRFQIVDDGLVEPEKKGLF